MLSIVAAGGELIRADARPHGRGAGQLLDFAICARKVAGSVVYAIGQIASSSPLLEPAAPVLKTAVGRVRRVGKYGGAQHRARRRALDRRANPRQQRGQSRAAELLPALRKHLGVEQRASLRAPRIARAARLATRRRDTSDRNSSSASAL